MIKMMIVGRRRGGITLRQTHHYMKNVHGADVVQFIGKSPDLAPRRYIQNHVFENSFRVPVAFSGAMPDTLSNGRDFVTQVWFDHPEQAAAALAAPFYLEHLQPDEDRFVDQASVVKMPVIEKIKLAADANTANTADDSNKDNTKIASKLFVFYRAADGVSVDELLSATDDVWQTMLADASSGIDRVTRNQTLQRPGHAISVDLIDEVWLKDDEAALALGEHWLALSDASLPSPLSQLLVSGSTFVLMAHEHVMFAGAAL
ncbi:EthD domain-containing protein [Undibacterium sp. RTI2.1]|uniref:EthD domain-containing protein n=1 Tax=unclassified Undibacterium TaxID=2630295 RepID=UPI002AB4C13D|nr:MULTISPECIES: EthD domain-containing protein [unclassified Undibacterium]MDY7540143.1 EthD domain-containing protein [Undibacterium sp. 5I1]MEB0030316.1 EthD domain-containing protein [Undibacterium sp. RTI2.1]MEB0115404.1 EthD domain-containing protein [Undibacterium sp. RTI2.2]MEB0230610.1 EthD domain-containing protein [Undibacterium sp. 10I3]MEB0257070.1 EthD domain-containing protein [Undibacterium sp. 5I1]